MGYSINFPKDVKAAEKVYDELLTRGKERRKPVEMRWWVSYWYSRGARDFTNINYKEGSLQVNYVDDKGILGFQYEEILSKYQSQIGRLLNIDLSPVVEKRGVSLDGMRKAGIAQAALDAAFPQEKVNTLSQTLWPLVLLYGICGLGVWSHDEDSNGIEVIPPWELYPIPLNPASDSDLRGYIRLRTVPKEWVKSLAIVNKKGKKTGSHTNAIDASTTKGDMPSSAESMFSASLSSVIDGAGHFVSDGGYNMNEKGKNGKDDKTRDELTAFGEVWTMTADGYLGEYLIFDNGVLKHRGDHSQFKFHMPIRHVVDIKVGGFWPRSFFETLIPLNTEAEYVIGKAFQDMLDMDVYGIMYEPTSNGVSLEATEGGDGIRRVRYEPDYMDSDIKPYSVRPKLSSMLPIKTAEFSTMLMDRVANQPTALMSGDAPGRVDSSAGLGTLMEASSVPLAPLATSAALALSGCYKALLGLLQKTWDDSKLIDVTKLDDNLAGIKFDAASGQMELAENGLPHPDEVVINIASRVPKSKERDKMALNEALQLQIITPREYRIQARLKGLDLPVGAEVEWQNFRRAKYENLVLFGDGQQPGQVIFSERDMHEVHLEVLDAFMARPEFYQASPDIREKFVTHYQEHMAGMGRLPDEMPYAEQSAEMEMMVPPEGAEMGGMPPGMM